MSRILTHREIIPRRPDSLAEGTGFTESDSAILALNYPPSERTVGEARERHPTARFELLRQSRPDRRDGSCGGPNGHFRPLRRTGPPMATHGHLWPPLYSQVAHFYSQVAHCYALVKTSTRGTAQGLPAAFPGRLNRN